MCDYVCDNCSLEEKIEIIKSPTGVNAVWNKDDNTIYCNKKCLYELEKRIIKKNIFLSEENCLENNYTKSMHFSFNIQEISNEENDFYIAINEARVYEQTNNPNIKIL
jgi:hypothetical protein